MKVKEEDLRRELLKAINGEDLIINCARRLGIRLDSFKRKLYTARIHGIESVLHSNRPGGYSDDLKLEVVDSLMKGMTKHAAARMYNISESTLNVWLRKYAEGGRRHSWKTTGPLRPRINLTGSSMPIQRLQISVQTRRSRMQ